MQGNKGRKGRKKERKKSDLCSEVFPPHQAAEMTWILPCQKSIRIFKVMRLILIILAKMIVGMYQLIDVKSHKEQ